jgi:16S rRNA processing protein RimM
LATKKSAPSKTPAKAPAKPAAKPSPKAAAAKAVSKSAPTRKGASKPPESTKKAAPSTPLAKAASKVKPAPAKAPKPPEKPKADVKAASKAKAAPAKAEAKQKPVAKAAPPPKAAKDAKIEAKAASKAPAAKGGPKSAPKSKPETAAKAAKPNGEFGTVVAAKPAKPSKTPKLAPVAAAFAKPPPAKPLAVAAGRAQPVAMAPLTTPVRQPSRPLVTPKPSGVEPETVGDLKAVPAFKGKTGGAKGMVLVGAVAGAFGVKGEVRLRAFTEQKDGVIQYGPLYGDDGKVLLRPKSWRELKDGVAVVAPEVKTREDAEKLKGAKLYVPRANLPNLPPEKDEYYWVDLMGCRAETLDGAAMGEVVAVWNFGAGDILELRPPQGGQNVRITFTKTNVPLVDPIAKRIVIDPPAPEPLEK